MSVKKLNLFILLVPLLSVATLSSCVDRIASRAYKNVTTISNYAVNNFVDSLKASKSSVDAEVKVDAGNIDSYFRGSSKNIYCLVTVEEERQNGNKKVKEKEEYELIGYSRYCYSTDIKRDAFFLVAAYPKGVIDEYCQSHYDLENIPVEDGHTKEETIHRFITDQARDIVDSVACMYMMLYSYYGHHLDFNDYDHYFLSHKKHDWAYKKHYDTDRLPERIWCSANNVSIFGSNTFGNFKFLVGIVLVLIALFLLLFPVYHASKEKSEDDAWDKVYETMKVAFSFLCGIVLYSLFLYWNEGKYWRELSGFVRFLCWISIIVFVFATIILIISSVVYYIRHKSLKALMLLAVPILLIPATLFIGGFLAVLFYTILIFFAMKAAGNYSSNSHFYPPVTNNLHTGDVVEYKGNHFEFLGYGGTKHWKLLQ